MSVLLKFMYWCGRLVVCWKVMLNVRVWFDCCCVCKVSLVCCDRCGWWFWKLIVWICVWCI